MPRKERVRSKARVTSAASTSPGKNERQKTVEQLRVLQEKREKQRAEEDKEMGVEMAAAAAVEEEERARKEHRRLKEQERRRKAREELDRRRHERENLIRTRHGTAIDKYIKEAASLVERYKNIRCDFCIQNNSICGWSKLPSSFRCDRCSLHSRPEGCTVESKSVKQRREEWWKPFPHSFQTNPPFILHLAEINREARIEANRSANDTIVQAPMKALPVGNDIGERLKKILDTLRHISATQEKLLEIGTKFVRETEAMIVNAAE
ncbi:hypothetical protein CPB86DRAFT_872792 [Serendipita vermifera]|nr:hypothetical protein CPB86DRAFT_872792 [Serendipita vermifera]